MITDFIIKSFLSLYIRIHNKKQGAIKMKRLKEFMAGRYGGDQLSIALILLGIILTLLGRFTRISLFSFIAYIPLLISIYRMFSKDISKRRMENYKFSIYISPIYSKYKKIKGKSKDRKNYKYYKCPNCKANLRLPKGKGKITITCPKCNEKFKKRT